MDSTTRDDGAGRRLAVTSIFGPPRDPRTWSAAPASMAEGLEARGFEVVGVDGRAGRPAYAAGALLHLLGGHGRLRYSEAVARGAFLRRLRARRLQAALARLGVRRVLHTGTLDFFPEGGGDGLEHFLYCDSTWHLSLRHRPDAALYTSRAVAAFDALEHAAYHACRHIFTFGDYVRDDLIGHYGVPAARVTAVGSGCGVGEPFAGDKDYAACELLFVAKHLFREKGGDLLLAAFRLARARNPALRLTIVGGSGLAAAAALPGVAVLPFVDRAALTALQRRAALLVQPMLNDPWGQVYLEALLARTPVMGLDRNGLPEIAAQGACGFLVSEATPEALEAAILEAVADPLRLAEMGGAGQAHVLARYSWDRVAEKMAAVLGPVPGRPAAGDMAAAATARSVAA